MKRTILLMLFVVTLVGCNSAPPPDIEGTVSAAVLATVEDIPTQTPYPTYTPIPEVEIEETVQAAVEATVEDMPTQTPYPTYTPVPTDTSEEAAVSSSQSTTSGNTNLIKTELGDDTTLYEYPLDGFSVALPNDWLVVDLNGDAFADMMGLVGDQNEGLETLFNSDFTRNMVAMGMKLYAINMDTESLQNDNPANINILTQELPFSVSIEQYLTLNTAQLGQMFDLTSEIDSEIVTLGDDIEAGRIAYTANLNNALGLPMEVSNVQYMIIQDGSAYILTVAMPLELAETYQAEAVEAVETFRFLEK